MFAATAFFIFTVPVNKLIYRYIKHCNKFDKYPKTRVLPLILNVHNRAGISSDKLGYIALCPAFFFSGLFDCQPQPVKIKFFC